MSTKKPINVIFLLVFWGVAWKCYPGIFMTLKFESQWSKCPLRLCEGGMIVFIKENEFSWTKTDGNYAFEKLNS